MKISNHIKYILVIAAGLNMNMVYADNIYRLPEPKKITIDKSISKGKVKTMMLAAKTYAAFWDTGEEAYAEKALADKFIDLNLPEGRKQGVQGPLDASKWFRSVVPDLHCKIEEMIVVQNKVVLRLKFTGHFTGKFGGSQGKGQNISFSAIDMYTIENGKIKFNWHLEDNEALMKQLKQ